MKVRLDFGIVVSPGNAIGNASGEISAEIVPNIGDTISFMNSEVGAAIPGGASQGGLLRVVDRVFDANGGEVLLSLEDMEIANEKAMVDIISYLERCHMLVVDYYQL